MTTICYFSQYWNDTRLKWTPNNTNNIEVIILPAKSIWIPDTMVVNSADTDGYLKLNNDLSFVAVKYTGEVNLVLAANSLKTRCSLNMENYPFDNQTCTIILASWANPDNRIEYSVENNEISLYDYTENSIWRLTGTDLKQFDSYDRVIFEESQSSQIQFSLLLQRKPLYYMLNSVFPCLLLNLVTIFTFFMPFGNQLGLCMTGFLTFSVYSLRISTDIPVQSDYLPKITVFFMISICYSLFSMAWFLLRNHFMSKCAIPGFLDKFCSCLQVVFFVCFPKEKPTVAPTNAENKKTVPEENTKDEIKINIPDMQQEISKCNFCNRCKECDAEHQREKTKSKTKKTVESKLEALNYFFLVLLLITMSVSQIAIWASLKSTK